jgi:N-acetylglucosamine kinase-like BadF-type ATPase
MKTADDFLILGIEGGGTKTTWALLKPDGQLLKRGKTTAGNVQLLTDAQLNQLFVSIRVEAGNDIAIIGSAFAGCHLESERNRVKVQLQAVWPNATKVVVGEDTRSAYAAAHGEGEGLIIIAGTGSNVQGHKKGRWEKAGGYGHVFADPGSGYDIARRGLEAVYIAYDVDHKVPKLGQAFLKATNVRTLEELVPYILAHSTKTEIASLCPCVFSVAKTGDKLAKKVIQVGAENLVIRLMNVVKRLGLKNPPIGCMGSLLEKEATYYTLFRRLVAKKLKFSKFFFIKAPGDVGAARMAYPALPV